MQHLTGHWTYQIIQKKMFLGAPLKSDACGQYSYLLHFLASLPTNCQTIMVCTSKALYMQHLLTQPYINFWVPAVSAVLGIHFCLAKKQRSKERFFFKVGNWFLLYKAQFPSLSRLHLLLATHSCKLELNVLYIIHTLKGNVYVHTNPPCSLSSLSLCGLY